MARKPKKITEFVTLEQKGALEYYRMHRDLWLYHRRKTHPADKQIAAYHHEAAIKARTRWHNVHDNLTTAQLNVLLRLANQNGLWRSQVDQECSEYLSSVRYIELYSNKLFWRITPKGRRFLMEKVGYLLSN